MHKDTITTSMYVKKTKIVSPISKQYVLEIKKGLSLVPLKICDPGGVRTPNPQSRNLIFYPVELQGHSLEFSLNILFMIIISLRL